MWKIKLRRAGGYDPARGRDNRDPTLEDSIVRAHVREHIAAMNQLSESIRAERKRGAMLWNGGQRGDPPSLAEIRAMRCAINRLRREANR